MPGRNLTIESLGGGIDTTHILRARFRLDDGTFVRAGAMTVNDGHHRDGAECETAAKDQAKRFRDLVNGHGR